MREREADRDLHASGLALVGRYTYRPDTDSWWWSDNMFRIHGFEPGSVVPTTELVLRHIHPEDREAAWQSREDVVGRQEPFSFLHRIRTATGDLRVVVAAGHLAREDGASVVHGHLVDITTVQKRAVAAEVETAVIDFVEHRAVIEQAKGVLAQLYSVDVDTAFALLRVFSADTNRRIRDIAAVLVAAASSDRTPAKRRAASAHTMLDRLYADLPPSASPSA
ncbi:PAS and ANTAR domain-containing protein [Nocardioides xinjiangensis]|uniref:PAS and ANTAR domain-containing protein n=1 Tax=Nocardioides xinjiangensis TaxID=2817376 RepID=UPI001B31684B|nr:MULTISPECIES: PAS and ANTAR domain-containing protein [unclassified Nocardioides]